jgi:hypothetical protein
MQAETLMQATRMELRAAAYRHADSDQAGLAGEVRQQQLLQ